MYDLSISNIDTYVLTGTCTVIVEYQITRCQCCKADCCTCITLWCTCTRK